MNKLAFAAAAACVLLLGGSASAAVIADFQLNGDFTNSAGSAVMTSNGGTLGATGLTFGANEGPTITGLGTLSSYTLETQFSFENVDGYRRIADFSNRALDDGLYVLDGDIDFYNQAFGPGGVISAGELVTVKLTRSSSGFVRGYINGVSQFAFNDTSGLAVINDQLNLFLDDFAFPDEASAGFVNYATISTFAVPEPATWALMVLGFGGLGAALRSRRHLVLGA